MKTYFISDGTVLKIGKSSDPTKRLRHFQTSHARPLSLVLVLPGDREKELHKKFHEYHKRGEWFRSSYEIETFIVEHSDTPYRRTSFYSWLIAQQKRPDDIGRFAVLACTDPLFPRFQRLYRLLRYYDDIPKLRRTGSPELRKALRHVHKEWRLEIRRQRDVSAARIAATLPHLVKKTVVTSAEAEA